MIATLRVECERLPDGRLRRAGGNSIMNPTDLVSSEILDALAEGVVVHDATGRIVLANGAAERIFGLREDQITDDRWAAWAPLR
jgi:PAS domain-containing protein